MKPARARRKRFNEAPAISPGNRPLRVGPGHVPAGASMRPRRFRRGIPDRLGDPGPVDTRFNEAPAISPGNHDRRRDLRRPRLIASMRPRRFRRGIRSADSNRRRSACASMRPRRFRRGIPDRASGRHRLLSGFNEAPAISPGNRCRYQQRFGLCDRASMRPRRFRRGIQPPYRRYGGFPNLLQ